MSRSLLIIVAVLAGCTAPQSADLRPLVAVSGKYSLLAEKVVVPSKCSTCGGTGRLGDGKVFVPCPDCQPKSSGSGTCRKQ
jgi:hypothetical protein